MCRCLISAPSLIRVIFISFCSFCSHDNKCGSVALCFKLFSFIFNKILVKMSICTGVEIGVEIGGSRGTMGKEGKNQA